LDCKANHRETNIPTDETPMRLFLSVTELEVRIHFGFDQEDDLPVLRRELVAMLVSKISSWHELKEEDWLQHGIQCVFLELTHQRFFKPSCLILIVWQILVWQQLMFLAFAGQEPEAAEDEVPSRSRRRLIP
jgi:hypothetical protein